MAKKTSIETLQTRLRRLRSELNFAFLERETLIDVVLTALISKQNLFVGGDPGTGKTDLLKVVAGALTLDHSYYLVDATTSKDELIGSIDMEALLNESKFRRDLVGGIATTHLVILDEGFKGNSPTLNSVLGLMLDRVIQNGKEAVECPLVTLTVLSNELPQDESLAAFWDRLALRCWVEEVGDRSLQTLLERSWGMEPTPQITEQFSLTDLEALHQYALVLPCETEVPETLVRLRQMLSERGIEPSTRKWLQITRILQAYATLHKHSIVTIDHLEILKSVLWEELSDIPVVAGLIDQLINQVERQIEALIADAEVSVGQALQESPGLRRAAKVEATLTRLEGIRAQIERMAQGTDRRRRFAQRQLDRLNHLQSSLNRVEV